MRSEKLIVALDVADDKEAKALVRALKKDVSLFKVGLQLFTAAGPSIVKTIQKGDVHKVMLDLKFHDIPTTVAKAVMEATRLGVFMMTLHALGGKEMLERAAEAALDTAEKLSLARPRLIAITVPTSRQDIAEVGITSPVTDEVVRLARLAKEAGCDGVVCSPQEIAAVRGVCGSDFTVVVPGIRLGGEEADDQKRIDTPKTAIDAGADYIVVGRPILRAADPVQAVQKINAQLHGIEYREPPEAPAPELAPLEPEGEAPAEEVPTTEDTAAEAVVSESEPAVPEPETAFPEPGPAETEAGPETDEPKPA